MADNNPQFNFNISLSVLNHLGRNLYRNFITVIGEAISNSWDADANNVWITINRSENYFVIKDDGEGMSRDDFQDKFLKIGYTKRKHGDFQSPKKRPFIGRKGIGKLALLSCATKISIISKTSTTDYIGGIIDNDQLDKDIKDDINAQESKLSKVDDAIFSDYKKDHTKGTIIYFEDIHDSIKNRLDYIKTLVALYFRFSLIDGDFNIHINGDKITVKEFQDLADKTEFLWKINTLEDPYLELIKNLKEQEAINSELSVKGFIASVKKPSNLKIRTSDEKVGIDLFVNGRLREKDILRHFSTFSTRVVASYLYGQIHFNQLDGGNNVDDKFTSSREGIKEGDIDYQILLDDLEKRLNDISNQWDKWRIEHKQDGDVENDRKDPKQRAIMSVVNRTSDGYTQPKDSPNKSKIDKWLRDLNNDAQFNLSSYVDCFLSENLIRNYIEDNKIDLTKEARREIEKWKTSEDNAKSRGNVSIEIIQNSSNLSYLSMDSLANLCDKNNDQNKASLSRDAMRYKPMRNAIAHTAKLTPTAKNELSSVYENIKNRLNRLFSGK